MRSTYACATAALAALMCVATHAPAAAQSLKNCRWEPQARYIDLVPRAIAASPDGGALLAADDYSNPAQPSVRVLRSTSVGGEWEEVDHFLPAGAAGSGARALHVDAEGNAFLLAWVQTSAGTDLVLRRSLGDGAAGTWETAEERWPGAEGGALTSDPDGRVYVAYGFAGTEGVGWRVESALRGIGSFRLEDQFLPGPATTLRAIPLDLERAGNGRLVLAGQLDGSPDEWVVRERRPRPNGLPGRWQTLDRYRLSASSYGLLPRAVAPLAGGGVLAVGAGVPGGATHDYRWLERRRVANANRWVTRTYQVVAGQHTEGHDVALAGAGLAVAGIGQAASGNRLQVRESADNGRTWQTVVEVAGVDRSTAKIAGNPATLWIAAIIEGAAVVIGCER